jgi:hypothetical protein
MIGTLGSERGLNEDLLDRRRIGPVGAADENPSLQTGSKASS